MVTLTTTTITKLSWFLYIVEWKLGLPIHVIKKVPAIRLHKNFKVYEVVKAEKRIFLDRLDKDNQLTVVPRRVL